MKLLIIRHGESEADILDVHEGRAEADEKYPFVPNLPLHASVYEQESKLEFRYRAEYILSKIIAENDKWLLETFKQPSLYFLTHYFLHFLKTTIFSSF